MQEHIRTLLQDFLKSMEMELYGILDWWSGYMVDEAHGGFYGRMDGQGQIDKHAHKGVIMMTRCLWTFSEAARRTRRPLYRSLADKAHHFLVRHFWDNEFEGVFWSCDSKGNPVAMEKQVYAQAFAIYAWSAYHQLPGVDVAAYLTVLDRRIREHAYDGTKGGYFTVCERNWAVAEVQLLSDEDMDAAKIMNTHLHLLEAYSTLYRTLPQPRYRQTLQELLNLFTTHFCQRNPPHMIEYFDADWNPLSENRSFGHDIEASWLLYEAAELLHDQEVLELVGALSLQMVNATIQNGWDLEAGGIWDGEQRQGLQSNHKTWWPQAEAIVGFLNAFQLSGDPGYLAYIQQTWALIDRAFKDRQGEWHWEILATEQPNRLRDKAGFWKSPYHNARMCMEVISRIEEEMMAQHFDPQ